MTDPLVIAENSIIDLQNRVAALEHAYRSPSFPEIMEERRAQLADAFVGPMPPSFLTDPPQEPEFEFWINGNIHTSHHDELTVKELYGLAHSDPRDEDLIHLHPALRTYKAYSDKDDGLLLEVQGQYFYFVPHPKAEKVTHYTFHVDGELYSHGEPSESVAEIMRQAGGDLRHANLLWLHPKGYHEEYTWTEAGKYISTDGTFFAIKPIAATVV